MNHGLSPAGGMRRLQAILDASPVGIAWSDANGAIEYVNRKFTELFGYAPADIPDVDSWHRLAFPDALFRREVLVPWLHDVDAARAAGAEAPSLEAPIACKDGSVRHVIVTVSWVDDRRILNFSDITDRWSVEQREHARHAMLELIAKGASLPQTLDAIVRGVEAANPTTRCAIMLRNRDGAMRVGAAPHFPADTLQDIENGNIACGTAPGEATPPAGQQSSWCEPIAAKGRLLGSVVVVDRRPRSPSESDLYEIGYAANLAGIAIEYHQAQEELERQAHTDFLTELNNRRHFLELAETELARMQRYGKAFSLLMLDIDHFKAVNDTHGHKAGDIVLQALAALMRRTLREVDVVGRLGGEEFAALLPETSGELARQAAERLRLAIAAAPIALDGGPTLHITVSIGLAMLNDKSTDIDMLLRRADEALYAAKHGGRNRVCVAEPDLA